MSSRSRLQQILHMVVEKRFLYYGFTFVPINLAPEEFGIEISLNSPRAEATGSTDELFDVLSRYLGSYSFEVTDHRATRDELRLIARMLPRC